MSVGIKELHFKVANFIGLVNLNDTAIAKLAILAFLYHVEIVKNS